MRKFSVLLKKELKELITWQSILPLIIGVLVMFFIGNTVGGITKQEAANYGKMAILDEDRSEYSSNIKNILSKEYKIVEIPVGDTDEQALAEAGKEGLNSFLRIPKGFGEGIYVSGKAQQVTAVTRMTNLSVTASGNSSATREAVKAINDAITTDMIQSATGKDAKFIKNPVIEKDRVFIGQKSADIDADTVVNSIMMQSMFLPIVLFIVITFASQMIAAAVANEKADKTLETLLSAPVSRTSVLFAKMSGAGIVALIYAGVYMLSFFFYMNGISGGAMSSAGTAAPETVQALQALGLQLQPISFVVIGVQLFLSILIALSLALMIGATAKDIKSAQAGVAPIMFLIIIPYMLTLFTDIGKLPAIAQGLIYILPFTHSFTAMNNMFLGNTLGVVLGCAYQAVFLAVMIWLAVKLFNSDKILTLKLEFKKKGRGVLKKS